MKKKYPRQLMSANEMDLVLSKIASAIVKGVDWMLSDQGRANEVLGAIANEETVSRVDQVSGEVLRSYIYGPALYPGSSTPRSG